MERYRIPEKGKMELLGHTMNWEILRNETGSALGINQSRICELNLYRDGTIVADYCNKWIRKPNAEDEASNLCINYLIERYGSEKSKGE